MPRTPLLARLQRIQRIARFAEENRLSAEGAVDGYAELERRLAQRRLTRRELLGGLMATAAAGAGALAWPKKTFGHGGSNPRIAIVGGGLAGLVCADRLRAKGCRAVVYEATQRLGGRVASNHDFPGQVAERGGELINTLHKTMLGYAGEFNLAVEDLNKAPGVVAYRFNGRAYTDAEVVAEYRELVARMRPDLQSAGLPTFFSHTPAAVALDYTDLATYLDTRAAGLPLIRAVLGVGYDMEYGRELHDQSCLNLLFFVHLDRRGRFAMTGQADDERFHIVGGNDQVASHIAARLPGPVVKGARLSRLARNTSGEFELWFNGAGGTPERADAVVLTLPFTVLRTVELDPSLGLSADKLRAINELPYGYNMKTMIGFDGRPWWELHGNNGQVYSDLANVQFTWESSWTTSAGTSILVDYPGARRAMEQQVGIPEGSLSCSRCHGSGADFFEINDKLLQRQADSFLTDLDRALPGTKAAATRADGKYRVVRGHWLAQGYSRGSYACPQPGYFTTICGLEAQPAGLLKFAGCHTNSFYDSQGYMEGACLSGIAAAGELLDDIKTGRL